MSQEFEKWVDQWDKALKDGVFDKSEEKPVDLDLPKPSKENFFGSLEIDTNSVPDQKDIDYWNDITNYSESENTILNESEKKEKKERVEKIVNSPNPIEVDTVNKDTNKLNKTFVKEDQINKLAELKDKMYKLENELITKEILGKNYKKAEKALQNIKKLIDKISDSLNQGKFEPSTEK